MEIFWTLNSYKAILFLVKTKTSRARWERNWNHFITDTWKTEHVDWSDRTQIYTAVVPFSRKEYIGETIVGLEGRGGSHQRDAAAGKMLLLYKYMRKMGPERFVWFPLKTWRDVPGRDNTKAAVPKVTRLQEEASFIFERQATLNKVGRTGSSDEANEQGDRLIVCRRLRDRQLMKFRTPSPTPHIVSETPYRRRTLPQHLIGVATRLGRRPLKVLPNFNELLVVRRVLSFNHGRVIQLIRLIQTVLDATTGSIALFNLKLILRQVDRINVTQLTLRNPIFSIPKCESLIVSWCKKWVRRWSTAETTTLLYLKISASKSPSTMGILDSTYTWSAKSWGDFSCPCPTLNLKDERMVEGHAWISLKEWLEEKRGVAFPRGFTLRSKLVPDQRKMLGLLQNAFDQQETKMKARFESRSFQTPTKPFPSLPSTKIKTMWGSWIRKRQFPITATGKFSACPEPTHDH